MYCVLIKVFLSLCVYCMCVCAFAGKKKQVKSELDTCELQIIALKQQDTQNKNMLQVVQTDCDEMQLKLDDQHSALEMLRMDKVQLIKILSPSPCTSLSALFPLSHLFTFFLFNFVHPKKMVFYLFLCRCIYKKKYKRSWNVK